MKQKILIVGNDANAYALAKKLSEKHDVFVTPKSDSIEEFAQCLDIREDSLTELLDFALENNIDMTIPVSQKAIQADIVTVFAKNNQQVFAPTARANAFSAQKNLAKKMFYKLKIPTPKFGIFEKESMALDYIKNQKVPFVIKTNDSNSATIVISEQMAKNIVNSVFIEKNNRIIIEDYVYGTPFTYYAITDGYKALPFGSSLNYRYSLDGDGGQLTAGMGACSPNYKLTINDEYFLMDNVVYPIINYLENGGTPYLGIIGINCIKSDDGNISVIGVSEFPQNADSASIFENIDEDIYNLFESCIIGTFSDEVENVSQKEQYCVSLVMNCKNKEQVENPIQGFENLGEETIVSFYPKVKKNKYLEYEIPSGQAVVLTSCAPTVASASNKVYSEAESIDFIGKSYRKDICRI